MRFKLTVLLCVTCMTTCLGAHADAIYSYQSHTYESASPPFYASDSLSGSFTLAEPLAPNNFDAEVSSNPMFPFQVKVLAFSFFDGVTTYSSSNPGDLFFGYFQTGADGLFTMAESALFTGSRTGANARFFYNVPDLGTHAYIGGFPSTIPAGYGETPVETNYTLTITPEPPSLVFLGTGVLGTMATLRKRFA